MVLKHSLFILAIILLPVGKTLAQENHKIFQRWANKADAIPLPYTDSIGKVDALTPIPIRENEWDVVGLEVVEEYNQRFLYTIFGKYNVKNHTLLLIKRDYAEETIHWGVLFSKEGKLVDTQQFAYDNAEGFTMSYAVVKKGTIKVYTDNIYENPQKTVTVFIMGPNGFYMK